MKKEDLLQLNKDLGSWTLEDIDALSFRELSALLAHHLGCSLQGMWEGSRPNEIMHAMFRNGIECKTEVTSRGFSDKEKPVFVVRFSFWKVGDRVLGASCGTFSYHKGGFDNHKGRMHYGQMVGKLALAALAHRERLRSMDRDLEAHDEKHLATLWTYNKPQVK